MNAVLPITPAEAKELQEQSIPPQVIDAFNDLLKKKFNGHSATIRQDEVIDIIMSKEGRGFSREDLFTNHWLDIEDIYRKAGWKVTYDKPAYCENYAAFWVFKK